MTEPASILSFRRTWPMAALIAGLLLINFILRLPTSQVADWGQFAFYDPGTVLKGELLLRKGYVPTVDFGYTHGLLSLWFGHVGFALLGMTPAAFFVLTLGTEMVMAWALARILRATLSVRLPLAFFLLALPMAIMPAYLTLTHPLEAMLILLALAAQAEEKYAQALALLTICLFVKPSMAYVYGFVLVVRILWSIRTQGWRGLRTFVSAIVAFIVVVSGLVLWMGVHPVLRTLFPSTGVATYAASGFGFFGQGGRAFWLPANPLTDFLTPAAPFLIAAMATAAGAVWAIEQFASRNATASIAPQRRRAFEIVLTVGILHTAFLLGFYGWTGSWTYYAYLPLLGLTLLIGLFPPRLRLRIVLPLVALLLLSHTQLIGDIASCWRDKVPIPEGGRLYAYPDELQQFHDALWRTEQQPALLMSNGFLHDLPGNVSLPDAWFPEPGIPTAGEIARVKAQAFQSHYIILWWEYRQFDLWNSPDFADVRMHFEEVFHNDYFTVLRAIPQP